MNDLIEKDIGFYGSLFASVSLPAKTPKKRYWTRTNGRDTLIIEAGTTTKIRRKKIVYDESGNEIRESLLVPAGIIPRHVMLYLSYIYKVKQAEGDNTKTIVLGNSLNDFLKRINISKGGKTHKLVSEQVKRLFNCRIGTTKRTDKGIIERPPKPIIDESRLWWSEIKPDQTSILPSEVIISNELASILDKSFPLDIGTVKAIGRNILAFDMYAWLTYRHYNLSKPVTISFDKLHEQFGSEYKELRNFKTKLKTAFNLVKKYYPHNSILTDHGIELRQSKTDITPKQISRQKSQQLLIDMGINQHV
jgi:hypothetical protein